MDKISSNQSSIKALNNENEIYFNFSYSALKLLGKNLYSNAANAISELVANALDAKSPQVYVYIDMSDKAHSVIEIIDNGSGMSYTDLADKYVWIGRNKRKDSELSDKERQNVMGRKGIGKLAALYLSNCYYIFTKKQGDVKESQWKVNLSAYDDSDFPKLDRVTTPVCLVNDKIWKKFDHGTAIKLENVDLRQNGEKKIEGLRRTFADFYLVEALNSTIWVAVKNQKNEVAKFQKVEKNIAFKNFYAIFDNSDLNVRSKMLDSIAFTWSSSYDHIKNKPRDTMTIESSAYPTKGVRLFHKEDGSVVEKKYALTGWIGIHSTIEQKNAIDSNFIRNSVYQPNKLRLYVRNKLAVADYLTISPSTQAMANYIEGEISFDILDDDDLPDIATSSRQDFLSDERIELLISIVDPILSNLYKLRNRIGKIITDENNEYTEYLKKVEQEKARLEKEKREAEEKARLEAERKAIEAENARKEAERQKKLAEERAAAEAKRCQYVIDVSKMEDKNLVNSMHSIFNMSDRVKKNIDELSNIEEFSEEGKVKLEKAAISNNRILSISKMISKTGHLIENNDAVKTVDMTVFLVEYVKNVLKTIYEKEDIDIECCGDLEAKFVIKIKPLSFIMMIDNIVGNAIKAHAHHMSIVIGKNTASYEISFVDDGDGIAESVTDLDKLFDFGVTTTKGSGLGLYYARKLITDMKGDISIVPNESKGVSIKLNWKI